MGSVVAKGWSKGNPLNPLRQEGLNPVTLPIAPHRYRSHLVRSEQFRALPLIAVHDLRGRETKTVLIAERGDRHLGRHGFKKGLGAGTAAAVMGNP